MHVKGLCLTWWLVMGYDQCDWSCAWINFVLGLVINSLYLFPYIQIGYVIRLHRLRIGGGEIQGAMEKKAKTRRTNEENNEM